MTSNIRKSKRRRHRKRGGGWFATKKVSVSEICDPNKLSSITDYKEMHKNYQTCCPKSRFGYKNSSPYCKQIDLNFQTAYKHRDYADVAPTDDDDVDQLVQFKKELDAPPPPRSKWWGGRRNKKTRRNKNRTR